MDKIKIGNFLYELRKEKELTQADVSTICCVSIQAVSKWENGDSIPDVELLQTLAKFYNISIEELLNGEKDIRINETNNEEVNSIGHDLNTTKKLRKNVVAVQLCGVVAYLVAIFLSYLTPFVSSYAGLNAYASFNVYDVLSSDVYDVGNYVTLISLLITVAFVVVQLLYIFNVFSQKYIKAITTIFTIQCITLICMLWWGAMSIGIYLLIIFNAVYYIVLRVLFNKNYLF